MVHGKLGIGAAMGVLVYILCLQPASQKTTAIPEKTPALETIPTPGPVSSLASFCTLDAGDSNIVAVRADGTVVATGNNYPDISEAKGWTDIVSVSTSGYHTVGLHADGTVVAVGENQDGQCEVSDWTDVVSLAAGKSHTVGLRTDGTVVVAGYNSHGQRDVSDWTGTDIVALSTDWYHTVGLDADGTVSLAGYTGGSTLDDVNTWNDIRLPFPLPFE